MASKLVISYETPEGNTHQTEYGDATLPTFYGNGTDQCITFCKGVLLEREIQFSRILEVYIHTVVYSAYDEGLKALEDA
jgi:hypothetical protein